MGIQTNYHYTFAAPLADMRSQPAMVPHGFAARLDGVDGRFTGCLRRHPGFRRLRTVGAGLATGSAFSSGFSAAFIPDTSLNYFKYVEIQKGSPSAQIRGFIIRKGPTVSLEYYDTQNAAWTTYAVSSYMPGDLDVTYGPTSIYVCNGRHPGVMIFWYRDALVTLPLGLGEHPTFTWRPQALLNTHEITHFSGGIIPYGESSNVVTVGIRFGDSRRGVWTTLYTYQVTWEEALADPGNVCLRLGRITMDSAHWSLYDTVEVYRTLANGTNLYRELYYHVPSETGDPDATLANFKGNAVVGTWSEGFADIGFAVGWNSLPYLAPADLWVAGTGNILISGLSDFALTQQKVYDWVNDHVDAPVRLSRIFYTGGVNYGVIDGDARWSRTDTFGPVQFPALNVYRSPRISDQIERFIGSGDFVYGMSQNRLFRFTRAGTGMAVEKVLHGWGLLNRNAVTDLGPKLALCGPSTLALINAASGSPTTVGAIERILLEDWRSSRSGIFLAYDVVSNCLYAVNPTTAESFQVWGTTNSVTRLTDTNFVAGTSGPHPESGGLERAYFLTANGVVVYPDADRQNSVRTMLGVTGTVNGTFSGSSTGTTLTDATASFGTLQDCYVHILTGASAGQRRLILSNNGTSLSVDSAVTVATGDTYAISPIPFAVIGWPVAAGEDDPRTPRQFARRRTIIAVGLDAEMLAGNGSPVFGVSAYKRKLTNQTTEASVTVTEDKPDRNYGKVNVTGGVIFPCVTCKRSDLDFELLGVVAVGTLEDSTKDHTS